MVTLPEIVPASDPASNGTVRVRIARMRMNRFLVLGSMLAFLAAASGAFAQADKDDGPTSLLVFVVTKADNGKPIRNAAVIMHPVNTKGKQDQGGAELKTDGEGKTSYDGAPYGRLRIQVLAPGFQTYGEDFDIDKPKMEIAIRLKRPQGQYSVYDDHSKDPNSTPKQDAPPPDRKNDPQNQNPN